MNKPIFFQTPINTSPERRVELAHRAVVLKKTCAMVVDKGREREYLDEISKYPDMQVTASFDGTIPDTYVIKLAYKDVTN